MTDELARIRGGESFYSSAYVGAHGDVRYRFGFYDDTDDGRNIEDEANGVLGLEPGMSLLDIGCCDGKTLTTLHQMYPGADLHGVEIDERYLEIAKLLAYRSGMDDIDYRWGDVRALPYPDHSMDRITWFFGPYVVANPRLALREVYRVLKPDGLAVITTSSVEDPSRNLFGNKARQRWLERALEPDVEAVMVQPHIASFNMSNGPDLLAECFDIDPALSGPPQQTTKRFDETNVMDAVLSLVSMAHEYDPGVEEALLHRVVNDKVLPQLLAEIAADGFYWDWVERAKYVCRPKLLRTLQEIDTQVSEPEPLALIN